MFGEIEAYLDGSDPFFELSKGRHPARLPAADGAALAAQYEAHREFRARLGEFSQTELSRQDEISLAIMRLKLDDRIDRFEFGADLAPVDAEGGFYNRLLFLLPRLRFETAADYEAYLTWLPLYLEYLEQQQLLMEEGISRGIVVPGVIVRNTLQLLAPFLADLKPHPLMAPFRSMNDDIGLEERERLVRKANALYERRILSVYRSLDTFFRGRYLEATHEDVGISMVPGGKAYYENRIRFYTTLPMTPEQVFSLGQSEVRRIGALMRATIAETGFKDGFAAFVDHLRTDPSFYPTSGEQLLHHAAWIAKQAEGRLPRLFNTLYSTPFTVEPVPDAIAPNYTAGRYVHANEETREAGIYWVNVYNLPSRSLYNLPALTLHEAVPGHHLQCSIARELQGIPEFRNDYYISAFGEGWGLYAEYLGEEMGMYTTPYERFGRYTYEMWRACRLVVDVGIHYKGWSRKQAIDFMRDRTALSEHEVGTEIDRYIGWPGQAVSYKVGELTIKRLRREAEERLGDKFDLRAFHEVVLRNGSIPLDMLEQEVRGAIDRLTKPGTRG